MLGEYSLPDDAFPFMLPDHPPSQDDSSQENGDFLSSIIQDTHDPSPTLTAEETLSVEGLESAMERLNLSNNPNNNRNTVSLGLSSETNDMLLNFMRLRAAVEATISMQLLMQGQINDPRQISYRTMPRSDSLFHREQLFGSQQHSNNNNNNQPLPRRGCVLLMAKDQSGCRSLQAKIDEGRPEVVEMILSEVKGHVHELMTHPYVTYLVQKIFEATSSVREEQKDSIAFLIISNERKLGDVCMDYHGNRAIQQMVDSIKERPRTISVVVDAMRRITHVLMKNDSGGHVILHCMKRFPAAYQRVFLDEIARNCVAIAKDKFGCCFIQKCLSHAEGEATTQLVREIMINAVVLADDPYGNYVVQFIVSGFPSTNEQIIEQLRGKCVRFSMNKHASNVVECLLEFSKPNNAAVIVREIMESRDFINVLQDPFGNFVAQTALECTKGRLQRELYNIIFSNSGNLHSHPYGKRVLASAKGNRTRV